MVRPASQNKCPAWLLKGRAIDLTDDLTRAGARRAVSVRHLTAAGASSRDTDPINGAGGAVRNVGSGAVALLRERHLTVRAMVHRDPAAPETLLSLSL